MTHMSFIKNNSEILIILLLYSILAIFSLQYYSFIAGDEISYIDIAHAYATGEWANAVNGIWSPLYSWLMAPFFLFNYTPFYGTYVSKILSLIIGFFTIISIRKLANTFEIDKIVTTALTFSSIPVILYFSLIYNTPDLLVACVLIYYLSVIFDPNYSNKLFNGVLCGLIGALAYFSKSYAFPFFVVHFALFNLIYYFKDINPVKKRNILKNMVLGFTIFFIISGLWVGTISDKYGKLTTSTAGDYNLALVGPESSCDPVFTLGLIKPPNKNAVSIWDDPSYIIINQWSPFDSWDHFKYEISLLWKNILYTILLIESFFMIGVIILIASLWFIFRSKSKKSEKDVIMYIWMTMIIYSGGFCFVRTEWRYLWLTFILLMITGFYLIDRLYKIKTITLNLRNILLIVLICSFIIPSAYETILFSNNDNSAYNLSNQLKNDYGIHGNIASNEWKGNSLTISYYLNAKYYGQTKKTDNSANLQRELTENRIDYYFVWNNESIPQIVDYREITNGRIEGLKIYSRIKKS